jgi:hypothetical protein
LTFLLLNAGKVFSYSSLQSKRIRWVWKAARMEGIGMHIEFCWESQKERSVGRPRCGRIIFKWILEK